MLRGIYTAAMGMESAQKRQDVAANNIANSGTPSYKGDTIVSKTFGEVLLQNKDDVDFKGPRTRELGNMTLGVDEGEVYTDFKQGSLIETGKELDFAINGSGFFTVRYTDGIDEELKYTRDGSFLIDGDGRVVTADGGYVLARDASGGVVPMELGDGEVSVDSSGKVYVNSEEKYDLLISDFGDYDGIAKEGKNMYSVMNQGIEPFDRLQGEYEIKQGSLEQSNVDISGEMISMMDNIRSYQANQRVMKSIDETLDKAVNEVGALK